MKSQRSFFISPAILDVFICVSALQNFIQYLFLMLSIHRYNFYISIQNVRDVHNTDLSEYRVWNSKCDFYFKLCKDNLLSLIYLLTSNRVLSYNIVRSQSFYPDMSKMWKSCSLTFIVSYFSDKTSIYLCSILYKCLLCQHNQHVKGLGKFLKCNCAKSD